MSGHIDVNRTSENFRSTSTSLVIAACATSDCIASSDIGVWPAIKIASHRIGTKSADIAGHCDIESYPIARSRWSALLPHPCQPLGTLSLPTHASLQTSHRHRIALLLLLVGATTVTSHIDIASHRLCDADGMCRNRIASHARGVRYRIASHRPPTATTSKSHRIDRSKPMDSHLSWRHRLYSTLKRSV